MVMVNEAPTRVKRYAGYIRVSDTRGREGDLLSDTWQRKDVEAYSTLLGGEVVEWFIELDVSGTTLKRPKFLEAVERVEAGEFDGLVVARINRFARNATDAGQIVRRIEKAGGEFASAHERLDAGKYGKFTRTIFFALAELEADVIRENWLTAQADAVSSGRMVSPWTPAGFMRDVFERDNGKRKFGPLYPDPVDSHFVVEAFERRANGQDCGAIARFLTQHKVKKSRGGHEWTTAEVHRLLKRRIYIGELKHGQAIETHEDLALVDRELWDACQRMVTTRPVRAQRRSFLLSGIARCAACGYAMKGYTASAAMVRNGSRPDYGYYRCAGRHAAGDCPAKATAPMDDLDRLVLEALYATLGDLQLESAAIVEGLSEAELELSNLQGDLAAYVALESALGEHYMAGFEAKRHAVDSAQRRVDELRGQAGAGNLPPVAVLREELPKWPVERQRKMIASVLPCVMVRRMPRLTPVAERALPLSPAQFQQVSLPGNGAPVIRSFSWERPGAAVGLLEEQGEGARGDALLLRG